MVFAAENLSIDLKLSPILISATFKDMEEQFEFLLEVVAVVDLSYTNIRSTQLRYNMDKPGRSFAQI